MPKLSQETLATRFKCPHCPDTFRGRAALSGHIQFKHPPAAGGKEAVNKGEFEQMGLLQAFAPGAEFNEKETSRIGDFCVQWVKIKYLLESVGIAVNKADLKNYLITSIAEMKANQRLLDEMAKQINEPVLKYIEHQQQKFENMSK